jgi:hypothetical protein
MATVMIKCTKEEKQGFLIRLLQSEGTKTIEIDKRVWQYIYEPEESFITVGNIQINLD